MVQVAKLAADLVANTTNFDDNLKKSSKTLNLFKRGLQKQVGDIDGSIAGLGKGFMAVRAGVLGVAAAVTGGGLTLLTKWAVSSASAVNDMADRLQMTTGDAQRFSYAFKLSGVDAEKFEAAITKLNAKIADGEFKYKNATEGLYSIAEAVKNAKDDTERASIVNDAFGNKIGSKMLPALSGGADGLRKLGDEAERTGNVISDKTIRAADELGDTFDIIASTIEKNFQQGFLDEVVGKSGELRDVYTDPEFTKGIHALGQEAGQLAKYMLEAAAALGNFIAKYQELEHSGSFGLDEKFFRFMSKTFDSPANQAKTNASLRDKYMTKDYGVQFGPFAPSGSGGSNAPAVTPYTPSKTTKSAIAAYNQQAAALKNLLSSLNEQNDQLEAQVDNYGKSAGAIARAAKEAEIENAIKKNGIKLTADQQKQISAGLDLLEQLTNKQEENKKATEAQQEADRNRAQAFEQLGATFASAFEDAVLNGEDLGDVLNSLMRDILKLAIRTQLLQPLTRAFFGDGTSGNTGILGGLQSSFGGFLSSIFSPAGSHATGTDFVTRDTNTRVHRGEAIIDAQEVRGLRRGGKGGTTVNIYDRNNNSVRAQDDGDGNLEVWLDQASARNASRRGSKTRAAVKALSSSTITRR